MRHRAGRLQEEQALVGRCDRNPAAARFLHDELKVLARFKTEQRQRETILSAALAVATAGVAPGFREDGHDLGWKVDRQIAFGIFDNDFRRCR